MPSPEFTALFRISFPTGSETRLLPVNVARSLLLEHVEVALVVDGWEEPWPCRVDELGEVFARCPGGPAR